MGQTSPVVLPAAGLISASRSIWTICSGLKYLPPTPVILAARKLLSPGGIVSGEADQLPANVLVALYLHWTAAEG